MLRKEAEKTDLTLSEPEKFHYSLFTLHVFFTFLFASHEYLRFFSEHEKKTGSLK